MKVQTYTPQTDNIPQTPLVQLTQSAIEHVRAQLARQPSAKGLRLGVKSSGCSGWKYDLSLAETVNDDDIVVRIADDLAMFVDAASIDYVKGTQIDFAREGLNRAFRFNNPNVDSECGCGESFSIKSR
jgi:iron-sulfur cluster assembly accessory protein